MKEKTFSWLRWLMLAVALGSCWAIWSEFDTYTVLREQAIFSPQEMVAITAHYRFGWALRGLLAALFFYQFLTWGRGKNAPGTRLCDGVALSLSALIWGALWFWLTPSGPFLLFWSLILLIAAGGAAWSWRKLYLLHQSSNDHEEESQHER